MTTTRKPSRNQSKYAPGLAQPLSADLKLSSDLSLIGTLPIRFRVRSDLHLGRKLFHSLMGFMIAYIYMSGMSHALAVTLLASFLGFDLLMETLRLRWPQFNQKLLKVWGPFMRDSEVNAVSGIPYYLAASTLAVALFPKDIATLSILFLAFGDPMASLIGILYGKNSFKIAKGKSLVGTFAAVVTCTLVAWIYLNTVPHPPYLFSHKVALSLVGGIAGGMAELIPVDIDDNFTIPVVSGFALWMTSILFGM